MWNTDVCQFTIDCFRVNIISNLFGGQQQEILHSDIKGRWKNISSETFQYFHVFKQIQLGPEAPHLSVAGCKLGPEATHPFSSWVQLPKCIYSLLCVCVRACVSMSGKIK